MEQSAYPLPANDHRQCRHCKQYFGPIYGSLKHEEPFSTLSPRGIRMTVDAIGERGGVYFECFDCESRRKRRKVFFYSALAVLVLGTWLFGELSAGRIAPPW